MDNLTKAVRHARRVGIANRIEGIKAIRTAYPDAGLKGAMHFFDLITGDWAHVSAVNMAAMWCVEHWDDKLECDCSAATVWCSACDQPLGGFTFEQRKQHYNECVGKAQAQTTSGSLTSGTLMQATDVIKKIATEKVAIPAKAESWYVPGRIFPDQQTADYWQEQSKLDPAGWSIRMLESVR